MGGGGVAFPPQHLKNFVMNAEYSKLISFGLEETDFSEAINEIKRRMNSPNSYYYQLHKFSFSLVHFPKH